MENELVGKTIFLRSPITCASASRGDGVCYRCYGDIAYTNADINEECLIEIEDKFYRIISKKEFTAFPPTHYMFEVEIYG